MDKLVCGARALASIVLATPRGGGCGDGRDRAAPPARVGRPVAVAEVCLLLAVVSSTTPGPARADQAESAVGRVAAASIATGEAHTCALLVTGAVRCWGLGDDGELGYNSRSNVGDDPARPMADLQNVPVGGKVTAIAAGDYHTCALLTTGAVRCWGYGNRGQLGHDNRDDVGDGTGPSIKDAGNVPLGGKATAITAGLFHTCALLTTGAVRCWGNGADGQLGHDTRDNVGDGTGPSIEDAGNVPLGGKATAITAGLFHTCALLTTGAVRCWGNGADGQLGYDSPDSVGGGGGELSIKLAGDVPIGGKTTAIAAGDYHTCALLTTGAVRCWGYGFYGQLGHDSPDSVGDGGGHLSIDQAGDVPVGGTVTAITAGAEHACALLTTGGVRCWGYGFYGQLGHDNAGNVGDGGGASIEDALDVPVGGKATAVTAGAFHSCAVLTSGALRCWGSGSYGQLGHDSRDSIGDDPARSIGDAGDVLVGDRVRVRASTQLSAIVKPSRDRHAPYVYRVTGHLHGPFVADRATCTGQVKVTVRRGRRLLEEHTTRLRADCGYRVRTSLGAARLHTHRSTRLTVKLRYRGNRNLTPAVTTRHTTAN